MGETENVQQKGKQGRWKGGRRGGARPPCPFSRGQEGGQKCPFIKYTCLIKNEQALAEVIICVKALKEVLLDVAKLILRLYILQA